MIPFFKPDKAAAANWSSTCASFGQVKQGVNPSFQQINCLLTNAALAYKIPPEIVKAVAYQESGWKQYVNTKPLVASDGGIGIMQLTNQTKYSEEKLKTDILYNIQAGVEVLDSMYKRGDLPKISGADRQIIENWYFPIMAYNGTKPSNNPIISSTGKRNSNAYQEKVLGILMRESYLEEHSLASYPFSKKDFQYNSNSVDNIKFITKTYTIKAEMHESIYNFTKGAKVVTTDIVNMRKYPNKESIGLKNLAKNTTLIINGNFTYDTSSKPNQYVWYPVKTMDGKISGFISSVYITKKVESPTVYTVTDQSKVISGKAPAGFTVTIKRGASILAAPTANKSGKFTAKIAPQKAGTKLTITYKNSLNTVSEAKVITVADKTSPAAPSLNKVTSVSKTVIGKAETGSTITLKVKNTVIGKGTADKAKNFKINIKSQKANTVITAIATDASKNTSKSSAIKVLDKTPPAPPSLNKTTSKSKVVTGKAEAGSTVILKANNKQIGTGKTDKSQNFKITIKPQKANTIIMATATDSAKNTSKSKSIKVVK
ncbi:lytic transglycosylase domain-containing protein [Niallia nealsonii]|uniref:Lytic transglycosylase domain-containing protein n=1 Tax=Niallia nealsonii TaxID=115979 RepID=A0A2N0YX70_9BACI|nr:lytic transglycosylase domain-containing protein [Niallia nealsonii]